MERVAEEKLEVALVRIDPLPRNEPDRQRNERKRGQRRDEPDGAARRRVRLGADVSGGNVCGE
jgi:hypothetical protein